MWVRGWSTGWSRFEEWRGAWRRFGVEERVLECCDGFLAWLWSGFAEDVDVNLSRR